MANRPIKKWRSSNFEIAVWLNERERDGEKIGFKTLTLTRNWKKKDEDIWRSDIMNLRRQDLAKVSLLLRKAEEELFLNKEEKEKGDREDDGE